MKSYFGTYHPSPGAEPLDATVLVFDKNLNIGFRNSDGSNAMVNWLLKDVTVGFDFPTQQTKLRHTKLPGELFIHGKEAAAYINDRQAEQQKPWHKKSGAREWIRNSFLLLIILGVLFALYLLFVPWLSQKLASRVSVKTEKQLGDAVYNAMGVRVRDLPLTPDRIVSAMS